MNSQNYHRVKFNLELYLHERPLFLSLIRSVEASLYADYLPLIRPVLDVGAGDGFFAKIVFQKVDVGLDIENSRILEASKQRVYTKLSIYDGKIFPFKSNTFSTVVSNCVFEHIPDLPLLLSEIYRVLKPGGKLLTTVMAEPWEEYLFGAQILGDWYRNYMRKSQVHLNLYTHSQWNQQFRQAGFKIHSSIGYLDKSASGLVDICHYISVPSLISYKLTGKWVIHPILGNLYPINYLAGIMSHPIEANKSGAIFYELIRS